MEKGTFAIFQKEYGKARVCKFVRFLFLKTNFILILTKIPFMFFLEK